MPSLAYFIRHGQTDWNAEGRLQGQADIEINERGRRQAGENGRRLAEVVGDFGGFDFVASPLARTRETMRIVREAAGLEGEGFRTDPRLKELHFGDWQGSTFAELEAVQPGATAARAQDKWNFLPPGEAAESYAMLTGRISEFLAEKKGPFVCVTHGGVIRCLFRLLGGYSAAQASKIEVPQDRVLELADGRLEWR